MTPPIPYKLGITYGASKIMITIKFHRGAQLTDSSVREQAFCEKWDSEYIEFHTAPQTLETFLEGPQTTFEHRCRNGYRVVLNRSTGSLLVEPPESTA